MLPVAKAKAKAKAKAVPKAKAVAKAKAVVRAQGHRSIPVMIFVPGQGHGPQAVSSDDDSDAASAPVHEAEASGPVPHAPGPGPAPDGRAPVRNFGPGSVWLPRVSAAPLVGPLYSALQHGAARADAPPLGMPHESRFLAYWRRFMQRVHNGMVLWHNARGAGPGQDSPDALLIMAIESFNAAIRDWQILWVIDNPDARHPDFDAMLRGHGY